MCFAINAYLGDLHCCCLDPAVWELLSCRAGWVLAFSFAHGFIFRLESSAGAAGIGAAHSGPGVARVWFQRRFIHRLYVVLTSFLLLLLPGT